jgi:hypothetical protein
MKNALAAVTFAMVLLAATFGLRNATTATVKAAAPAVAQALTAPAGFNGLGDPAPSCPGSKGCSNFAMNGLGDPAPSGPRSNSMNFNGLGDPAPSGPRSNSMSF